jgi:hypothetical protein
MSLATAIKMVIATCRNAGRIAAIFLHLACLLANWMSKKEDAARALQNAKNNPAVDAAGLW